jgi:hypothetical protein
MPYCERCGESRSPFDIAYDSETNSVRCKEPCILKKAQLVDQLPAHRLQKKPSLDYGISFHSVSGLEAHVRYGEACLTLNAPPEAVLKFLGVKIHVPTG